MTRVKRQIIVALAVCAIGTVDAFAQSSRPPQGRQNAQQRARGGEPRAMPPGEVLNMLDAYAVLQGQKALELGAQQEGEFIVRLKRLQQTRRRNLQARNGLVQELRRLTAPNVPQVDDAAIRDRVKQLREHDDRAAAELRKAYDHLDEILDARQQGRFRVFEETLERRKLDLLMRARRATRPTDERQ